MGFTPLHTDSGIQVVQLAGAQGNRLRRRNFSYVPNKTLVLPYSHACLLSGSQACPVAPLAWDVGYSYKFRKMDNKYRSRTITSMDGKTHFSFFFSNLSSSAWFPPSLAAWSENRVLFQWTKAITYHVASLSWTKYSCSLPSLLFWAPS